MASLVRYPGKREVVVGAVGRSVWSRGGCGGLLGVIAPTPVTTYDRGCGGFREFDGRMGRDDSRDIRCLWLSWVGAVLAAMAATTLETTDVCVCCVLLGVMKRCMLTTPGTSDHDGCGRLACRC